MPNPATAKRPVEPADGYSRFPGCRPIPLLSDRLTDFDGRLEYWEARTQTARVVAEPAGGIHEGTSRRLPHLAERIALVRGAPIASFGSVDLLLRDPDGVPERMMQACGACFRRAESGSRIRFRPDRGRSRTFPGMP